mgnify:CR=1 FL=1
MTTLRLLFILLFALYSSSNLASSTSKSELFKTILYTPDFYSSLSIRRLNHDQEGFLWIGTGSGLYRFDGYEYKKIPLPVKGINSGNIHVRSILPVGNKIWVGTISNGVFVFDKYSFKSVHYLHEQTTANSIATSIASNKVNDLAMDKNGDIWLATDRGLNKFNVETEQFEQWRSLDDKNDVLFNSIYDFSFDSQGVLWLSTGKGLAKVLPQPQGFYTVANSNSRLSLNDNSEILQNVIIRKVFLAQDNRLWLSTQKQGSFIFEPKTGLTIPLKKAAVQAKINTSIAQPNKDEIWISGTLGIEVRHAVSGKLIKVLTAKLHDGYGLKGNVIYDMTVSSNGTLWLGVNNYGLQYTNHNNGSTHQYQSFNNYNPQLEAIFNTQIFGGILISDNKLLVINHNGVKTINLTTGEVLPFFESSASLSPISNGVLRFSEELYFFGSQDGELISYNSREKIAKVMTLPLVHTVGVGVRHIIKRNNNEIIIGTDRGALSYNFTSMEFGHFLNDKQQPFALSIKGLLVDKKQRLWLSTSKGLGFVAPGQQQVQLLTKEKGYNLSSNYIVQSIENNQGDILINTRLGIERLPFEETSLVFNAFTPQMMTKNSNRNTITESSFGYWLGNSVKLDNLGKVIEEYDENDGLIYNTVPRKVYPLKDNSYLHINSAGIMISKDKSNVSPVKPSKLVVTNLLINHESRNDLINNETITLAPGDSELAFRFSSLNLVQPKTNQYRYRLEGYDNDWIQSPADIRQAKYNSLEPGSYNLIIQGGIDKQTWSDTPYKVEVVIQPYFYQTLWFKVTVAILFMLILAALVKWRIRHSIAKEKESADIQLAAKQAHMTEDLLKHKNRLLANISHELKTPLTLISGPLEYALSASKDNNVLTELAVAKRNTHRLNRMVEQILHLAQLESKHQQEKQTINFSALINQIYQHIESLFSQRDITVSREIKPDIGLYINKNAAEALIINLLSNAAKYCNERGDVLITLTSQDDSCTFTVQDSGTSLNTEEIPHLFERFTRQKNHQTISGTGIGLALVKEIVTDAKGEISCEYQDNTCFKVILPLAEQNTETQGRSREHMLSPLAQQELEINRMSNTQLTSLDAKEQQSNANKQSKILIVEDNKDMRDHIGRRLASNYHCLFAEDGQQGVDLAIEQIPDLIITDLMMPHKSGNELAQVIREHELTCHIPIILLTANGSENNRIAAWRADIDAFMEKPFDSQELLVRIENILSIRQLMAHRLQANLQVETASTHVNVSAKEELRGPENSAEKLKSSSNVLTNLHQSDQNFLELLDEVIEKHYTKQDLTVKELSSHMALSSRQLQRKLNALIDTTASDYIRSYRLNQGAKLIKQGLPITTVALEVGFSSQNYFSQCFKAYFEVSPTEYQQQT